MDKGYGTDRKKSEGGSGGLWRGIKMSVRSADIIVATLAILLLSFIAVAIVTAL